jgi:hypothetical protein
MTLEDGKTLLYFYGAHDEHCDMIDWEHYDDSREHSFNALARQVQGSMYCVTWKGEVVLEDQETSGHLRRHIRESGYWKSDRLMNVQVWVNGVKHDTTRSNTRMQTQLRQELETLKETTR